MDKQLLLVDKINEAGNNERLYMDYKKYNIAFLSPPKETIQQKGALFPEDDLPVENGLEVYFSQCSQKEGEPNSYTGTIVDVQNSKEGETIFSITPPPPQTAVLPYPVFAKVKDAIQLMGIFSPLLNGFVHIQSFNEEVRKTPIIVTNENFKGHEGGNRGSGPRYIRITGEGIDKTYQLKYCIDGKTLNPHQDNNYDENKNKPQLYLAALDRFVKLYKSPDNENKEIPNRFEFRGYKNSDYLAE